MNEWKMYNEYVKDELIVRVNVLPTRDPIYSVEVGRMGDEGFIRRHFPADMLHDVIELLEAAAKDHAKNVEKSLSTQAERVEKSKAKKQQYLANQERRREENRTRAARR